MNILLRDVAPVTEESDYSNLGRHAQLHALRAVWKGLRGEISIVPAVFLGRGTEDPVTGWGELRAMIYVMSVLYSFYSPEKVKIIPSRLAAAKAEEILGDNIIVIGGPVTNELARMFFDQNCQHSLGIPFRFDEHKLILPDEGEPLETQFANKADSHSYLADYGCLIHRTKTLWGKTRQIWLFCGCHTYGSYAAAVTCFSEEFCGALVNAEKEHAYNVIVKATDLQVIAQGHGELSIHTHERSSDLPGIGPIRNSADVDAVVRSLTVGLRAVESSRKRLAYSFLALAISVLVAPDLVKIILHILRSD